MTAFLPSVGVEPGADETVEGVALIVTSESSIGGPWLVAGPRQRYDVRPLSVAASVIQS